MVSADRCRTRPGARWHGRLRLGMLVILLSGAAAVLWPAAAQTPGANVPDKLSGDWSLSGSGSGSLTLQLTPTSAIFLAGGEKRLGYIQGTFSVTDPMQLNVLLELAAFQQDTPPLQQTAWSDAVTANSDAAFPGYVRTSLTLRYDADKDEMAGQFVKLDITDDKATGKYVKTEANTVELRFVRNKQSSVKEAPGAGDDEQP